MYYEEDNPRYRHRREAPPHHREHLQDARSRWGEPRPQIDLHRDKQQPYDIGRFEERGQFHQHREDWQPEQGYGRHYRAQHPDQDREPMWRRRNTHFSADNQHANDRWQQPPLPGPEQHRRRQGPPDEYWQHRER